ncbi:hypothetical protein SAMN02745146_3379 [Hymenobacter daecheongensis DSM 21074]|uniref:Uncharacterized protein n=1 Tax=Hymenobacter daecheongensis DSM 21074 TaxID=1121955 RepID=A0A1M6K3T1_9BACT|nr:hypothetical protein [Hymenobacter daecheongensis]SHJ53550.1 hypothetical protein SAMN02745146_3379 [Hymenobacter daecheongensis DSM 21074]
MKKKPEESHFKMSQAALVTTATEKLGYLRRDVAALTTYGVTPARLDGLQALTAAFVALPTETEGVQQAATATQAKDAARLAALGTMQHIMGMVGLLHNDRTPQYKAFGTSGLNSASEGDLYLGLVRAVRVGRANLPTYAPKGLTAADLTLLETQNAALLATVGEQHDAESGAAGATQQRLTAGNALYDELAALCEAGKTAFVQTDVSKYQDYVLYDTPPPAPVAPAPTKPAAAA